MSPRLRAILLPFILLSRPIRARVARWKFDAVFRYHKRRFYRYSGMVNFASAESARAFVMMNAHVLEKGLTMPGRRMGFGRDKVLQIMDLVTEFEKRFGSGDILVSHAAGLVLAYRELHMAARYDQDGDVDFWNAVNVFCGNHSAITPSWQPHVSSEGFYAYNDAPFPEFAAHRHTVRHYAGPVPSDTIRKAVLLAQTAPSACNRQHVRVHCVSDHHLRDELLALQRGNRGFGSDADKLLVITADEAVLFWQIEHADLYLNAGIFIMNLCYALHYYKVGCCILNWCCLPAIDQEARRLLKLPNNETIVASMTCGVPPDEFEYASSPRRALKEILIEHL